MQQWHFPGSMLYSLLTGGSLVFYWLSVCCSGTRGGTGYADPALHCNLEAKTVCFTPSVQCGRSFFSLYPGDSLSSHLKVSAMCSICSLLLKWCCTDWPDQTVEICPHKLYWLWLNILYSLQCKLTQMLETDPLKIVHTDPKKPQSIKIFLCLFHI